MFVLFQTRELLKHWNFEFVYYLITIFDKNLRETNMNKMRKEKYLNHNECLNPLHNRKNMNHLQMLFYHVQKEHLMKEEINKLILDIER